MNFQRPVIRDLPRSSVDVSLELLSLLGIFVLIGIPLYYYWALPEIVPQHFNFKGEADGWGGKSALLILPSIGVLLYFLLTVLSQFPHILNYPWPITEANARRQYANSRQMISVVKLLLVATFVYITWSVIGTALGKRHGLGTGFTMFETPVLFAIIGLYIFKANRAQ